MTAFAKHLVVGRYGIEEVATWNFEVWNEPNLDFWDGKPKQASYWELYDHTGPRIEGGECADSGGWWTGDGAGCVGGRVSEALP